MNCKSEHEKITSFIREKNDELRTGGGVVGLSGGLDSSVCAKLIVDSLGIAGCLGIIMPAEDSNPKDRQDALQFADYLGIATEYYPVEKLLSLFEFEEKDFEKEVKPLLINMQELLPPEIELPFIMRLRGRAYILSYYSKKFNLFQCQTLEKTEWMLGLGDKFGDGAGDIAPLMHLFKSEVYELAEYLGLPRFVLDRKPTSGNYPLTDEEELQMKYPEETDAILKRLLDGMSANEIANETGLELDKVCRIDKMLKFSQVKRDIPQCL